MFLKEKKIRALVRQVLLREAPFDPTDVTKSFDLDKAIDLARKLVLKPSVKDNEKNKQESIKISKSLAAIRDGVAGEPTQRFQVALANLSNFEGPGKEEQEYKDLLKMVRDYLGPQAKKGDGQAEEDEPKPKPKPKKISKNANVEEIQKKLNSLNFKDYRGKKLTVDGKWGKATRSATSKMLKTINEEFDGPVVGLFKKLNLNEISNDPLFDKLATGSKGPGSWKKLAIKLVQGKPFDIDTGDGYAAALAILDQYSSTFRTAPSGGEGDGDGDGDDGGSGNDPNLEIELIDAKRLGPIFVRKITNHGKKGYQKALEMGFGYKTFVFNKDASLKFPVYSFSAGDYLTYGSKKDGYRPLPNYWMREVVGGRGNSRQTDPLMDKPYIGFGSVGSGQEWICYYVSPQTWGNIKLSGVDREFSKIKKGKVLTTDQKIPGDYEPRKKNVVWCVNKKKKFLYIFDLND